MFLHAYDDGDGDDDDSNNGDDDYYCSLRMVGDLGNLLLLLFYCFTIYKVMMFRNTYILCKLAT